MSAFRHLCPRPDSKTTIRYYPSLDTVKVSFQYSYKILPGRFHFSYFQCLVGKPYSEPYSYSQESLNLLLKWKKKYFALSAEIYIFQPEELCKSCHLLDFSSYCLSLTEATMELLKHLSNLPCNKNHYMS